MLVSDRHRRTDPSSAIVRYSSHCPRRGWRRWSAGPSFRISVENGRGRRSERCSTGSPARRIAASQRRSLLETGSEPALRCPAKRWHDRDYRNNIETILIASYRSKNTEPDRTDRKGAKPKADVPTASERPLDERRAPLRHVRSARYGRTRTVLSSQEPSRAAKSTTSSATTSYADPSGFPASPARSGPHSKGRWT